MLTPIDGGVTAAPGFLAAGVSCGVRARDGRKDLALIVSEVTAVAAGVLTQNAVPAAPVLVAREHLAGGRARAIVANSGVANACTGPEGLRDARAMAEETAAALGIPAREVLVASTGVIGERLPMDRVRAGIRAAAASLSREGGRDAAAAILTTDTVVKEAACRAVIGDREVTLGGVAKGSGMIRPRMATMLAFLTTDAAVEREALQSALRWAVDRTFNMVTVDGDTSTNDAVFCLASGLAGNEPVTVGTLGYRTLCDALEYVCGRLARAIARDGEGATRLLEVVVRGAADEGEARRAALAVAGSNLVKAAVYGADANWGRILAALGAADIRLDPDRIDVDLGPLPLVRDGRGVAFDEGLARSLLREEHVVFTVDLHQGEGRAVAWGCDLSEAYV
ncbi:MAG: bifunctional glutamate N-acetyltransferase/amino-acid acetyltransferase ArgJ, partial [Clostridia bacterium]|nr:bifunctional glutamate N-acetyltransferase/amino-acid acetyltransferase ArgJ [Clostridia bacterium]